MNIIGDYIVIPLILFFFLFIPNFLAMNYNFYRSLTKAKPLSSGQPLSINQLCTAFFLFLLFQVVLMPIGVYLWLSIKAGEWVHTAPKPSYAEAAWINLFFMLLLTIALMIYCLTLRSKNLNVIVGDNGLKSCNRSIKDFLFGAMSWFISYPLIFVVSQSIAFFLSFFSSSPEIDQVAVKHLKMTLADPPLFWATMAGIVVISPIVEELIFRGFLQNWLKAKIGSFAAILTASVIFSAFHYSSSQGIQNFELLPSLFVLSCYLGYLYERQHSIWAPIGLHLTFNFISACMIILQNRL